MRDEEDLKSVLTFLVQDTIPIQPSHFGLPPEQALITELNKKYANKVLHDVGLCICVFDIAEAGEGKVRYGDGFLWYAGTLLSGLSMAVVMAVCAVTLNGSVLRYTECSCV